MIAVLALAAAVAAPVAAATTAPAAAPVPAAAPADPRHAALRARLDRDLADLAGRLDGVAGWHIRDLATGETIESNAGMVFPAASTIKVAVLLELLRRGQEGTIPLDRPLAIDPAKRVEGGGIMQTWRPPYPPLSPDALAVLMMDDSDNFATNILIDLVGMESVQARLAGWGLRDTRLQRRMLDVEAARAGRENLTTPRELAGLMGRLRLGGLLDASGTSRALAILAANDGAPIDRALPDEVAVAEKEGQLEGVEGSVAIVEIPGRPFVVAVLTTYLHDRRAGQQFIGDAALLAWRYFGTLAASSEHGRRMEP